MTVAEKFKQRNPTQYYAILDWKDSNFDQFEKLTGKVSLSECSNDDFVKLLKAIVEQGLTKALNEKLL